MKRLFLAFFSMLLLPMMTFAAPGSLALDDVHTLNILPGNSVGDMALGADSTLWIAAGGGIAKTGDFGETWTVYRADLTDHFPRGSASALQVSGDTVWVATVFDTTVQGEELATGGGLGRSFDAGSTWTYIPQPTDTTTYVDSMWIPYGDTEVLLKPPTTTNIQNVTYDLAFEDSVVWITSWGGGIRRSSDYGATWLRIPTPMDNMDFLSPDAIPEDYVVRISNLGRNQPEIENQKGFSVTMDGNEVWIGTSGGVNHSTNGGLTWRRYHYGNSNISGNWILALKKQKTSSNSYLWASTGQTFYQGEVSGISVFDYSTGQWRLAKEVRFANNFTMSPSTDAVYAATDAGIFKTLDFGYAWESFGTIYDKTTGEPVYGTSGQRGMLYAISVLIGPSPTNPSERLWVGTTDGLAYTDNEYEWHVKRAFSPTSNPNEANFYAYPNPFSPSRHNILAGDGHVRFQYHMRTQGTVTLRIYDFSMDKVADVVIDEVREEGPTVEPWDGSNLLGDPVANGVYFCKIQIKDSGQTRTHWTKLLVID